MSRQYRIEASQIEAIPPECSEDDDWLRVDLRLKLGEVAQLEAELLRRDARRPPSRGELTQLASKIYKSRRVRDRVLDKGGRGLFGEPAWDMLLALYCFPSRGELLTVTSLSFAAEVPQTTGHRWQQILIGEALIERGPETCADLRRRFVRLTTRGRSLMESYLTRLFYSDAPLPTIAE